MDIKLKIKTSILSILAIVIMITVIGFLASDAYKSPRFNDMIQLDSGWMVQCASEVYYPEILSETVMPIANNKDVITLTSVLPDSNIHPAVLHFRSILSTVEVYLDDELIYNFGQKFVRSGKMLPKFHHFIPLPQNYSGKEIKIIITAQENNAFSGLSPIILGNEEEISRDYTQNKRLALFIGVFLVVLGFTLFTISPFLVFTIHHDYSITFSGLLSVLLGMYILCFNDLFWLFSDSPSFYTFLEYFSLFLIPSAILGFLIAAGQIGNNRVSYFLLFADLAFVLITTLLHIFGLAHICQFVPWLHVISIIEGILVIITLTIIGIKRYKNEDNIIKSNLSTTMLLIGLLLFLCCSVIDIVKFNILKFITVGEVNTDISFMTLGALVFILCLILNYFFHCIESISESNMKKQLEGLAYTDSLTGISNRSKCELELANLDGNYTIISIDLDYLKYTNDNYGHTEGDRLLNGFAEILKNSFTDASLIGRMGGDEFIIILPYIDNTRTSRDLECLTDLMKYRNTVEKHIKYSASYGFADSKEKVLQNNLTAQNVYLLADTRMYVMKNEHHKQTLGRLYDDLINNQTLQNEGGNSNAK